MISRFVLLGVAVLATCATAAVSLAASEDAAPKTEQAKLIEQLLDRIEKLEARVEELEKREKMVIEQLLAPGRNVPKGWQRREFNGRYYYIIPLDSLNAAKHQEFMERQGFPNSHLRFPVEVERAMMLESKQAPHRSPMIRERYAPLGR